MTPFLLILSFLTIGVLSKDELSTFHYTADGELVYFQGSYTKTLNYTEARHFCQLMGGDLPTSFDHIFPLVLTTFGGDGDLFWLGPMKDVNKTFYKWPNGARFQYSDAMSTNKDCQDGRCCAVAAKWSSRSGGGKNLQYLEKSCYLIHRPVCVIKNTLGTVAEKVAAIEKTHETIKRQLETLRPINGPANRVAFSSPVVPDTRLLETNYIKNEVSGRVYYYDTSLGTYDESVQYCKGLGGILTSVSSQDEATFLAKLLGPYRFAWVGATKSTESERYTWLDASPMDLWTIKPSKDAEYALALSSYREYYAKLREIQTSRSNRRICLMKPIVKPTEPTVRPTDATPKVTDPPVVTKPATEPPTRPPTEPATEPPTRVTDFTLPPGSDLEEKLEFLASRVNRQEELLQQLVSLLKKAYNS